MRLFRRKHNKSAKTGLVSFLATVIQQSPALAGGSVALVVAMTLITTNAVWFQPAKHPSPIISTRTAPPPSVRQVSRKENNKIQVRKTANKTDQLTRDIQTALSEKHFYNGKIDGIFGAKTRAAILAYQDKAHLEISGKVTAKLLSHILMSKKTAVHAPVPKSQSALLRNNPAPKPVGQKGLVSAIQSGLKNYGYDDVIIDGVLGSQTADAIRRFELDYGLRITGRASQKLLEKLTEIGAVDRS